MVHAWPCCRCDIVAKMPLDDLKLEDLKLSEDFLQKCRSCSEQLRDEITRLSKTRASTTDHLESTVEKLKGAEILSNLVTIAGAISNLYGISQSDARAKEFVGITSHAAKIVSMMNTQMRLEAAKLIVDADIRDQQLPDVRDCGCELFKTINDKIVQAIKERQGKFEIENAWFKEGALFLWSLFNILNSCAKLVKKTSLIESLGMNEEATKRIDQAIEIIHQLHTLHELTRSITDLYNGSESEGIKKVKEVIKALKKQQELWKEVFLLDV